MIPSPRNRRRVGGLAFLRAALLSTTGSLFAAVPAIAQAQPDDARVTELDTIHITPGHITPGQDSSGGARTENSGSVIATESTIGGKLTLPLRQTPRSVSVITRKRLDDENITSIKQAAEKATGVYVLDQGDLDDGPMFYSRGFLMSVSEDGVPLDTTYYGPGLDTSIYDRIEVLRGPDGLMQGQGQAGGSINLVRKAPLRERQVKTEFSAGQWSHGRALLDVSTPVGQSERVRARIVGAFETRDGFVDHVGSQRLLGYGTVEFDLADRTTLTLGGLAQKNEVNPYFGALHIQGTNDWTPRDLYGGAKWSRYDYRRTEGTIKLDHAFNDDWSLTATTTYRVYDDHKRFAFHNPHPTFHLTGRSGLINRATWFEGAQWTGDAHLKGRIHAFGRTHDLVLGANFESFDHERWVRNAPNVGLWEFGDPDVPYVELEKQTSTQTQIRQRGVYGQARIALLDNVDLHLGARLSSYRSESRTPAATTLNYDERGVFTPYGALVWKVTENWTLYGSYADIFRPQLMTNVDANGDVLPPVVGEQYEVGVKASLFGGRLMSSIAYFDVSDVNRPIALGGGVFAAAGEVKSRGVDIEVAARPTDSWELVAGYTYTDTRFSKGQPAEIGQQFNAFFPKHSFKLWTNHTVNNGGPLDGVQVGVGLRAFSESRVSFAAPYAATVSQPAYAVVDARLGYKWRESSEFSLNIANVFDKTYVPYPAVRGFYGEPRKVTLNVSTRW